MKNQNFNSLIFIYGFIFLSFSSFCSAGQIKPPDVSGRFYPADHQELSQAIEEFLREAKPSDIKGNILVLISPHAGYEFSGRTAAYGYKVLQSRHYDTVIVFGPSHYVNFEGAALWPKGAFRTPLGSLPVDESLSNNLLLASSLFSVYPEVFSGEHSIEVQLPFLQTVLANFKFVPVALGYVDFSGCENLAAAISEVVKDKNCLLVASSDMYHGFDYQEAELKDIYTLSLLKRLKSKELYERIQIGEAQLCGWSGVIISLLVAANLGYEQVEVLNYTNSAKVTQKERVGEYCVGYSSILIYKKEGSSVSDQTGKKGGAMLSEKQRERLVEIARNSIESYLKKGKKLEFQETDPVLLEQRGVFVTLHRDNQLRGCIGNIIGDQPLYLAVRDMAVEAAVNDPRFNPVSERELSEIEIEVSVLSPLEKVDNPDNIRMGEHGVLIRQGFRTGVFLPQVATETGWSKEEFLSNLCAHKAGLAPLAWKDPRTEIYVFTAEVFSE